MQGGTPARSGLEAMTDNLPIDAEVKRAQEKLERERKERGIAYPCKKRRLSPKASAALLDKIIAKARRERGSDK